MKTTYLTKTMVISFIFYLLAGSMVSAERKYIIEKEIYEISGRTREAALSSILGDITAETFSSKEELEAYAAERAQKMENIRSFKKSGIEVLYPETAAEVGIETGAPVPVTLKVSIQDGTPFFPIPYAFYNSNDGFQSGLLLTVPNVAGSLQNLLFMGLYTAPPDEQDNLQWTNPNFLLLGTWSGIRVAPFELSLAGTALKMSQRIEERGIPEIKMNMVSFSGSVGVTYPFTDTVSDTVSFRVAGSPQSEIVYNNKPELLAYGPISSTWKLENTLSVSDYNWIGNFRSGYKANLTAGYSSISPFWSDKRSDVMAEADFTGYIPAGTVFNPSVRVYSFINSGLPLLNPAMYVRGIRNNELKGNYGVFVNTGVQIKVVRFGSAELHLTPGLDYAFVSVYSDPDYTSENGFGVGSDLILIFDSMKTFPIKLGVAYDLRSKYGDNTAKRIEVDFNFSFSY